MTMAWSSGLGTRGLSGRVWMLKKLVSTAPIQSRTLCTRRSFYALGRGRFGLNSCSVAAGRPLGRTSEMMLCHVVARLNTTEAERSVVGENLSLISSLEPHADGTMVRVSWADGTLSRYHTSWLRLNCHCDQCKQPQTRQRLVSIRDFPARLTVQSGELINDGQSISLTFKEDLDHRCVLPTSWLKRHSYSRRDLDRKATLRDVVYSDGFRGTFVWDDVIGSEDAFYEWLYHLNCYGLTLLRNVPTEHDAVVKVANLIGPVTDTLYGQTFDVVTEPDPINVAYTSVGLDLHQDLVYYESPPGLQLLHCLAFDDVVEGGNSTFLDVFEVAEVFREKFPQHFKTLTTMPATFQKIHFERANPAAFMYQRSHINLNRSGEITAVTWAPAFEGPLSIPEEDVEEYYEAYRAFAQEIDSSDKLISLRLKEGDCIIFNNRRMLHGRERFSLHGGLRHLKGCYVNIDDFRNKVQYLHEKRGTDLLAKRVGNNCAF